VSVPQRIPLTLLHDGAERVVLEQQHSARRGRCGTIRERGPLVGLVHDAEAVQHDVRGTGLWRHIALLEQFEPAAPVRTSELPHRLSGKPPGRGDPGHGVAGLVSQGLRFHAAGFRR
jgi:hypothetical protein